MKRTALVGLFSMLMVWFSTETHAATLFSEDFEIPAGNVSPGNAQYNSLLSRGWGYIAANCTDYCAMSIVPAPFGRAGNVLRYKYQSDQDLEPVPAQDAHNSNLIRYFNPPISEVWARVYFATDVDNTVSSATTSLWFCCGTKLHYIKPAGPAPSYIWVAAFPSSPSGGNPVIGAQEMAVCPSGGIPVFKGGNGCNNIFQNVGNVRVVDKRWYCAEYHLRINSSISAADGTLEEWIDGVRVLNYQNQLFVDGFYTVSNARIGSIEVYRQHANHMYRYEDDIEWATTRIGCGAAAPGDTPAPGTPGNLRVQ